MDNQLETKEPEERYLSHRSYQYLYALCLKAPRILKFSLPSLFKLLSNKASSLGMTDLEIAVWAIYLDRFGWMEYLSNKNSLDFCAYTAMRYMQTHSNENIHDNSWDEFGIWLESKGQMIHVSNQTLNLYFRDLYYEEPFFVERVNKNYDEIVTDILESFTKDKPKRKHSDSDENFKM